MTGLLSVQTMRDGRRVKSYFVGGKRIVWLPPIKPFFWTTTEKPTVDPESLILLSHLHSKPYEEVVKSKVWKQECRNVYDVKRLREMVFAMEASVRYIERLCIEYGFEQNIKLENIRKIGFDIEARSSVGQFPNPRNPDDRLLALAVWGREVQRVFVSDDEASIVEGFVKLVRDYDPDVLLDYSGTGIDYEFPMIRGHRYGIKFAIGREGDEPYIMRRTYKRRAMERTETTIYLQGRLCMDVFKEVLFDTSLTGMRRTLKNIGRFFFGDIVDVVEMDRQRLDQATKEDLGYYCFSDARLHYLLGEHYMRMVCALANRKQVPLNMMVHRKPSHLGNLFYGRKYKQMGIVSDGGNLERFERLLGGMQK